MRKIFGGIPRLSTILPLGIIILCIFFLTLDAFVLKENVYSVAEGVPSIYERTDIYVDINHASKEELMKIPGIGEKLSEEIVRIREDIGGFKTHEDLLQVKGIGEKTLEKIAPYIEIKE